MRRGGLCHRHFFDGNRRRHLLRQVVVLRIRFVDKGKRRRCRHYARLDIAAVVGIADGKQLGKVIYHSRYFLPRIGCRDVVEDNAAHVYVGFGNAPMNFHISRAAVAPRVVCSVNKCHRSGVAAGIGCGVTRNGIVFASRYYRLFGAVVGELHRFRFGLGDACLGYFPRYGNVFRSAVAPLAMHLVGKFHRCGVVAGIGCLVTADGVVFASLYFQSFFRTIVGKGGSLRRSGLCHHHFVDGHSCRHLLRQVVVLRIRFVSKGEGRRCRHHARLDVAAVVGVADGKQLGKVLHHSRYFLPRVGCRDVVEGNAAHVYVSLFNAPRNFHVSRAAVAPRVVCGVDKLHRCGVAAGIGCLVAADGVVFVCRYHRLFRAVVGELRRFRFGFGYACLFNAPRNFHVSRAAVAPRVVCGVDKLHRCGVAAGIGCLVAADGVVFISRYFYRLLVAVVGKDGGLRRGGFCHRSLHDDNIHLGGINSVPHSHGGGCVAVHVDVGLLPLPAFGQRYVAQGDALEVGNCRRAVCRHRLLGGVSTAGEGAGKAYFTLRSGCGCSYYHYGIDVFVQGDKTAVNCNVQSHRLSAPLVVARFSRRVVGIHIRVACRTVDKVLCRVVDKRCPV